MHYSCFDCQGDIIQPWDGEHTTEPHRCATCNNPICWDCKNMDTVGEDYCDQCADQREKEKPDAFQH